jgi:hypothetical protein
MIKFNPETEDYDLYAAGIYVGYLYLDHTRWMFNLLPTPNVPLEALSEALIVAVAFCKENQF